jgi:hypothetical protein
MIRILAMRKVMRVGEEMDTDFKEHPCVDTEYNIYCKNEGEDDIFVIGLMETYGPCGSGYCMSSYGSMNIGLVRSSNLIYTHKYTGPELIEGSIVYDEENYGFKIVHDVPYEEDDDWGYCRWDEENEVFKYSCDGDDPYYPSGGIEINFDYFEEIPRAMKARPVYILVGPSGLGKSTLAECFNGEYKVFETDSVDELPEYIAADVIVVGNRSKWTFNDVKDRIWKDDDPDIIVVSFKKEVDA